MKAVARNRRVRKQHPAPGAVEDFFYDSAGVMLSERSFTFTVNSEGNTVDEYISLAGIPVAMVRSVFDGSMARIADWSGYSDGQGGIVCPRRGENARCATFFLIDDVLGRPAMVLDKDFNLTGVGEYDAFGAANRVVQRTETPHPYANNHGNLDRRFGKPQTMCDTTWKSLQQEYPEGRPWCECR